MHFSLFLPQGEGEARVSGRKGETIAEPVLGGRGNPGRKDRGVGGGGILEEEKAFLVPREKGALSEAVAQLGVCNPEVTVFKWPLCMPLPWGRLGVQKPSLCFLASPSHHPSSLYPRMSPLSSASLFLGL